ncbi:class I SAM-dependent methyltransferase [Glutamicibacter arilaitensis]|uniref:class I SAM-dependent methyltransferase n=1 Tax=Glutamicibacter arilaitensis TaxID=256701 RepID=UPI0038512D87
MPEIPSLPRRAFTMKPERRADLASAYESGAAAYDSIRPSYPSEALDFALAGKPVNRAIDIGCGSGIFTEQLVQAGLDVWAVDPSQDMLTVLAERIPQVHTVCASGESTGLPENSAELITFAQAWHWVDPPLASAEAARLLRNEGSLVLLWNQLDVQVPWVHRLARIMHAGDVHRPEIAPPLGKEFGTPESGIWHWHMELDLQGILELTRSRSYYRRSKEETRAKVEQNLTWYWCEHLGFETAEVIEVPYLTHAWRARRRVRR